MTNDFYLDFDTPRFPIRQLPQLLREAVSEVQLIIQAPIPLIVSSALSALSLVCQGRTNVRMPTGSCVPTSLMLLCIAESGERKSTTENIFLAPIRAFQIAKHESYQIRRREWEVQASIWETKERALLKAIAKKMQNNEETVAEEQLLKELAAQKPTAPRSFKMLFDDTSSAALFSSLSTDLPSVGLISSEGASILKSQAFSDFPKLNAMWSGDTITVNRAKGGQNYSLHDCRLTVSVMVQPAPFEAYMKQQGDVTTGAGLWARFLVCKPTSTQGQRFQGHTPPLQEHQKQFTDRLTEILEQNIVLLEKSENEKNVVEFSDDAQNLWRDVSDWIEAEIAKGGLYAEAKGHASKLAENIARVAALFHVIEGTSGPILVKTLDSAIATCLWFSRQYINIFVPIPQEQIDAEELGTWLDERWERSTRLIEKNYILKFGPSKMRRDQRMSKAISVLEKAGAIRVYRESRFGRTNNRIYYTEFVEPGPNSHLIIPLSFYKGNYNF